MADANGDDNLKIFLETIQRVEKERGSRIWCMIHHRGHICHIPTMGSIFRTRDMAGTGEKIEILLHSPGGHAEVAYHAMKFFRRRYKQVNVLVPLMAKSAATLMCLGADKIFMGNWRSLAQSTSKLMIAWNMEKKASRR